MRTLSQFLLWIFVLLLVPHLLCAQEENIQVGTSTRSMLVYVPEGLPQNSPLMISLHGLNQDPAYQQNQSKWEQVADTAKFAVVYPRAESLSWDLSTTKDINLILTVIDTMYLRYGIDLNRVYLSGFSMGGMMTYYAMTTIEDKIAAFAPVSGYLMGGPNTNSSRPIPIIHTHGTADDVVVYSGVQASIDAWVTRNNCPATPQVTDPYPANKTNSIATKSYWGPGDDDVEVVLLTLEGKGHWWSNDVASGVNTSVEIWNFCKNYKLDPGKPSVSIIEPVQNSEFTTLDTVTVSVTATDPDGSIVNVDFFIDNVLVYSDDTYPYSYKWENTTLGEHKIKVVATDNDNKTGKVTTTIIVSKPVPPLLQEANPERNSFNLSLDINTFQFTYDEEVNCDSVDAIMIGTDGSFDLNLLETGYSAALTFVIPDGITLSDGEYSIYIKNVVGGNGIKASTDDVIRYVFGSTDKVETIETVFTDGWDTENIIPLGWKVTYGTNTREQGTSYSSGPRVFKFLSGGDFDYGMYLRDEGDVCRFSYGTYSDRRLNLTSGIYLLSFYYSWWTSGAESRNLKIHVDVMDTERTVLFQKRDLETTHGVNENRNVVISGSKYYSLGFTVTDEQSYIIQFSTEQFGWDGAIIGGIELVSFPSVSDLAAYYINMLDAALANVNSLVEATDSSIYDGSEKTELLNVKNTYNGVAFTTANEYQAAVDEINAAYEAMLAYKEDVDSQSGTPLVKISKNLDEIMAIEYYTIQGHRIDMPIQGLNIVKTIFKDGTVSTKKVLISN